MVVPPLSPPRMLMALAWTGAFSAVYLWLMLYKPFRDAELTAMERRLQIGLLLVLTLLVLLVDVSHPTGWFWLYICVVMPAGVVLPTRAPNPRAASPAAPSVPPNRWRRESRRPRVAGE
jgi:hypothetical protein